MTVELLIFVGNTAKTRSRLIRDVWTVLFLQNDRCANAYDVLGRGGQEDSSAMWLDGNGN